MTTGLVELGALGKHAVELIHEERHGLVALLRRYGSVHIRAMDFDVSLGGKTMSDILFRVAFQLHPQAHDTFFMTKQSIYFVVHELLQRGGEIQVDAGDDEVVCALIHDIFGIWVCLGQRGCDAESMQTLRDVCSKYAVIIVTGGSSGIGKAFIEHIRRVDTDVLICNLSRREPDTFYGQLNSRHIPCDLADFGSIERAIAIVTETIPQAKRLGKIMLVNNSGFGGYGRVDEVDRSHQLEMIDVNVRAVVDLTARLLPLLRARGGIVINIASTAAFQPTAYLATYGATKAFLLHWSLGLHEELRGTGVEALAVCAGPTSTDFFRRAGLKKGAVTASWGQTTDQVITEIARALVSGRTQVVCGWKNWLLAAFSARLPKPWSARLGAAILRRYRLSRVSPASTNDGNSSSS